jgi:hypothetical protein
MAEKPRHLTEYLRSIQNLNDEDTDEEPDLSHLEAEFAQLKGIKHV